MNTVTQSRRDFLKLVGVTGGGLVVGVSLSGCDAGIPVAAVEGAFMPNAFVQITPDNQVRFYFPRDEMGQGAYMGLTTLVAEELNLHPAKIDVQMVGVHSAYKNPNVGLQGTGGSTSIKAHYYPLRQAAANARAALLRAAAAELNVDVDTLQMQDGAITHNDKHYPLGDFARAANDVKLDDDAPLKPRADFKFIGKQIPRIDAVAKSTGTAMYGIDFEVPDMHRAVVLRCPVRGGEIKTFDATEAEKMPGVVKVLPIFSGVAVVANSYWHARKAAGKVTVAWSMPELANVSSADIRRDYTELMASGEGSSGEETGEGAAGLSKAAVKMSAQFWTPYLAHATMEPMNALVRIKDGVCDVWSGNQAPIACQGIAAHYSGIDNENVKVHGVFSGGGFGRRSNLSHVGEAAQIARATGLPIQVIWTREDDIRDGYFRPASLINIDAGMNDAGVVETWVARRVGANVLPNTVEASILGLAPGFLPEQGLKWLARTSYRIFDGLVVDHASIEGLYEDYDWPNKDIRHTTKNHGIQVAYWRSVGHSFTAFAKESMMDELALKAGKDPVAFRLANTQNNPRLHNVIKIAGDVVYKGPTEKGRSVGIAAHGSFSSYAAQVAEVSVEGDVIRVHKVTCVFDCGQVVNPDIVRDQMSGAIIFGLTAALHGDIEIVDGAIKNSNFHDYPLLRMDEAPSIEVILVDSDEDPTGAGEPGLPPIAPAVANAVFAATGQRLRELPLKLG